LTEQKAPERILDLLHELRSSDSRWRALMVGDGRKMRSLRERARDYGIDDAILWRGGDPRGALAIQAVECICLPSRSEGLPYVLLESLAAGVPILATPVGGIPEVLAGPVLGRGCLEWDLPAWSERVQEPTAPDFSMEWARAARERIRTLDETAMHEALSSIYHGDPRPT
jgi:glycosyltransferase involved in cell wall biosynthesis